jgi:tetratricopeptide (TPR) repeat protein
MNSAVIACIKRSFEAADAARAKRNNRHALAIYDQILEIIPDYKPCLLELGQLYQSIGKFELSIEYYVKALKTGLFFLPLLSPLLFFLLLFHSFSSSPLPFFFVPVLSCLLLPFYPFPLFILHFVFFSWPLYSPCPFCSSPFSFLFRHQRCSAPIPTCRGIFQKRRLQPIDGALQDSLSEITRGRKQSQSSYDENRTSYR